MIGSWLGKFVGFIGGYNFNKHSYCEHANVLSNSYPYCALAQSILIITPHVRLRIGGAADAATTAYGGVVRFLRETCMFVLVSNHPGHRSVAWPSPPIRKRQERCYPEYSASGSRGAIPSTPQAEGGVLSQVLRKRQSGCYPKYSASGRRGAIILKIKCHFITGTSAKSAHDNLVHPIHL